MALIPPADDRDNLAADVDLNPIQRHNQPVHLNATDAQRAEIVRRYRLYSHQPDEMNTFMALASMNPASGDLDPKMYKYGGLWIYPVAALLQAGSLAGVIRVRGDLAYYLDYPAEFARFYVVARLYAVLWALVGVIAVWMIARRLTDRPAAPILAGLLFIFMPIVVIQAHEAKPHLPGTVLMLLTILAAHRYTADAQGRWAIAAGALCGAATGMVLSAWPVAVVLPMMVWMANTQQKRRWIKHLLLAGAAAGLVFVVTNPYLLINLFINRPLLKSHFENSAAFYDVGNPLQSLIHAARLVLDGASPAVAVAGFIVVAIGMVQRGKGMSTPHRLMASLLFAPATIVAMQFMAVAANQPADFARFALLVDVALAIAAGCGIAAIQSRISRISAAGIEVSLTAIHGLLCVAAFVGDAAPPTTRLAAAEQIRRIPGDGILRVYAEPAPFSLPPIDLWRWQIMLQPSSASFDYPVDNQDAAVMLRLHDTPTPPPWIASSPYAWQMTGNKLIGLAARTGHAAKPAEWIVPNP